MSEQELSILRINNDKNESKKHELFFQSNQRRSADIIGRFRLGSTVDHWYRGTS